MKLAKLQPPTPPPPPPRPQVHKCKMKITQLVNNYFFKKNVSTNVVRFLPVCDEPPVLHGPWDEIGDGYHVLLGQRIRDLRKKEQEQTVVKDMRRWFKHW